MSRPGNVPRDSTGLRASVSPKLSPPAHQGPQPTEAYPTPASATAPGEYGCRSSNSYATTDATRGSLSMIMNPSHSPTAVPATSGPTILPPLQPQSSYPPHTYSSSSSSTHPPPLHPLSDRLHDPGTAMSALQPAPSRPILQPRGARSASSAHPPPGGPRMTLGPLTPYTPAVKRPYPDAPPRGPYQPGPEYYNPSGSCPPAGPAAHPPPGPLGRPEDPRYVPPPHDPCEDSAKRRRVLPAGQFSDPAALQGHHLANGGPSRHPLTPRAGPRTPNGEGPVPIDTSAYPFLIDVESASKQADEKRMRNAGASARFRARKKEEKAKSDREIAELKAKVAERDAFIKEMSGYMISQQGTLRQVLSHPALPSGYTSGIPVWPKNAPSPDQVSSLQEDSGIQSFFEARKSQKSRSQSNESNGSTPPAQAPIPAPASAPPAPPRLSNYSLSSVPPPHIRPGDFPATCSPNTNYMQGPTLPPISLGPPQNSPSMLGSGPPSRQNSPNSRPAFIQNQSYHSVGGHSRSPQGFGSSGTGSPGSVNAGDRPPIQDGSEPGFQSIFGGPNVRAPVAGWQNTHVLEAEYHQKHQQQSQSQSQQPSQQPPRGSA